MERDTETAQSVKGIETALVTSQTVAAAGQFAAAVMHEINNPLEAISNLAYLIRQEAEDAEKVRRYTRLLEEQLLTVTGIARRTLSFYRPPSALEIIDLRAIAEAALRVHDKKITLKGVRLITDIREEAAIKVHAGEMLQVLSNLLSNAIDALPPKGKIAIRVRRSNGEVHLTVADDGHGIPDTLRPRIFEPFFTTKQDRGTGLGLAISKTIIERHQGRIRTRSSVRPGKSGTVFRVSLPLHRHP